MQDLLELPDEVRRDLKFVPATTLEDVLKVALPEAVTATIGAASCRLRFATAARGGFNTPMKRQVFSV
jgi:hypothetical protein